MCTTTTTATAAAAATAAATAAAAATIAAATTITTTTVTCYKQMTVNRTRTNEPPLFIGPLFIHDNSDFDT